MKDKLTTEWQAEQTSFENALQTANRDIASELMKKYNNMMEKEEKGVRNQLAKLALKLVRLRTIEGGIEHSDTKKICHNAVKNFMTDFKSCEKRWFKCLAEEL